MEGSEREDRERERERERMRTNSEWINFKCTELKEEESSHSSSFIYGVNEEQ